MKRQIKEICCAVWAVNNWKARNCYNLDRFTLGYGRRRYVEIEKTGEEKYFYNVL